MRLLYSQDGNLKLTKDLYKDIPEYAILSHTWGEDGDEVTYEDIIEQRPEAETKAGYRKLEFCLEKASEDQLSHVWIDTCCIDKSNHVELSRAIHSMYMWYMNSKKCYAYLSDITTSRKRHRDGRPQRIADSEVVRSRWFTRGWTLQELLAPRCLEFFSRIGDYIGTREDLAHSIAAQTGIAVEALSGTTPINLYTRKVRRSWLSTRKTTHAEDKAYCLIGLLGVSMPLIPGETEQQAMSRLKDAMLKSESDDLETMQNDHRFLADSPGSTDNLHPDARVGRSTTAQIKRREGLLHSLWFREMDNRRDQVKRPYSNTCGWLSQHPVYRQWLDGREFETHHGLLWIKGKPGAGKTTLVKYADSQYTLSTHVSFYFHARGTQLQKSIDGMYRSILYQLLTKHEYLQDQMLTEFETRLRSLQRISRQVFPLEPTHGNSEEINEMGSQTPQGQVVWSLDLLQLMLAFAFGHLGSNQVHCYVDALDECDTQEIRQMINLFETIGQDCASKDIHLRILVASRHYPIVRIKTDLELNLDQLIEHQYDLEQYVDGQLDIGTGPAVAGIKRQIVSKANGIFMWAVLVVDILNGEYLKGTIYHVQTRLGQLPPELSELFKEIVDRDQGKDIERFRHCLQWILYAQRPLTPDELYCALAVREDLEAVNCWVTNQPSKKQIHRLVSSSSKGLAEVSRAYCPLVQFIHESVRDYLLKDGGLQQIFPQCRDEADIERMSHETLARTCSDYLNIDLSSLLNLERETFDNTRDPKVLPLRLPKEAPFLSYAKSQIMYHADASGPQFQQEFIRSFSLRRWRLIENFFIPQKRFRYRPGAGWIYLCAASNALRLLKLASRLGERLYAPDAPFDTLHLACTKGSKTILSAVLEVLGIEIPHDIISTLPSTESLTSDSQLRPFVWAIKGGYLSFALALCSSSQFATHATVADLSAQPMNCTPSFFGAEARVDMMKRLGLVQVFWAAVKSGNYPLVQKLLSMGVPIQAKDASGRTALMFAAQLGQADMVLCLLENDAAVDAEDDRHQTALFFACQGLSYIDNTQTTIIHLLTHAADLHHRDDSGKTPLLFASTFSGSQAICRLLLDRGAHFDSFDSQGKTALEFAALAPCEPTVRYFIERGASKNAIEKTLQSLLLAPRVCRLHSRRLILKMLLKNRAEIDGRLTAEHVTPLMLAVTGEDPDDVKTLLEFNPDVQATDSSGHTALERLIIELNAELNNGQDMSTTTHHGQADLETRLHTKLKICSALLDAGAKIDNTSHYCRTTLLLLVGYVTGRSRAFGSGLATARKTALNVIHWLVASGTKVCTGDQHESSALIYGLAGNDMELLQILYKSLRFA